MITYQRLQVQRVVDLVQDRSTMRITAITGPRQTGKTTLAQQACRMLAERGHRCLYVALDDPTPGTLLLLK